MKDWQITLNTLQAGILTGVLVAANKQHGPMESVWLQLIEIKKTTEKEAGVVKTLLPSGLIELRDCEGTTIIREPMDWEIDSLQSERK